MTFQVDVRKRIGHIVEIDTDYINLDSKDGKIGEQRSDVIPFSIQKLLEKMPT